MGFAILFSWLGLAVIFVVFGKLCNSRFLIGIGVTMLLVMGMVDDVTY